MALAHMARLVHVGSGTSVESPIVFVDLIIGGRLTPVESRHVGAEVRVLAHARVDSEVLGGSLRGARHFIVLDGPSFLHDCLVVATLDIEESLVRLSELPCVGWLLTRAVRAVPDGLGLHERLVVQGTGVFPMEGCVILHKLSRARRY